MGVSMSQGPKHIKAISLKKIPSATTANTQTPAPSRQRVHSSIPNQHQLRKDYKEYKQPDTNININTNISINTSNKPNASNISNSPTIQNIVIADLQDHHQQSHQLPTSMVLSRDIYKHERQASKASSMTHSLRKIQKNTYERPADKSAELGINMNNVEVVNPNVVSVGKRKRVNTDRVRA